MKEFIRKSRLVRSLVAFYRLFGEALTGFLSHNGTKLSASLSYYTLFSLAPMLILVIGISGMWLGEEAVQGYLYKQFDGLIGTRGSLQLQEMIRNVKISRDTPWMTAIGAITVFIGSTAVFVEIQDSINTIWGVSGKQPRKAWIQLLIDRLVSFSTIIVIGFLLLVSLVFSALINMLNENIFHSFSDTAWWLFFVGNLLTLLAVMALFSFIYKVLPYARISWRDVMVGAFFSSMLFLLGKYLINLYLSSSNTLTAFGAAGSLVLIILWVYYSAIILYFGAEFTKAFSNRYGGRIQPRQPKNGPAATDLPAQ